ncbi:gluconate 2-dehydrogenase subunit 3 family protein [soil metagenome]
MDRRKYLKTLAVGTLSTGALLESCAPAKEEPKKEDTSVTDAGPARQPDEIAHFKKISSEKFFDEHEMKTISLLADIIIPKDEVSGSATDAKVPDFIEFIVKDMPKHQLPMRGGLKWLDIQCLKRFEQPFSASSAQQQIEIVDEIAWPQKAKPEMAQGVAFFNLMRDLTATGFFTSQIGIKDLGYAGNRPTQWDGVPPEVLAKYGVKYDEKIEYVKFEG